MGVHQRHIPRVTLDQRSDLAIATAKDWMFEGPLSSIGSGDKSACSPTGANEILEEVAALQRQMISMVTHDDLRHDSCLLEGFITEPSQGGKHLRHRVDILVHCLVGLSVSAQVIRIECFRLIGRWEINLRRLIQEKNGWHLAGVIRRKLMMQ